MSSTDILVACCARLESFSYSPAPSVAWPSVDFNPPTSGMWLVAGLFPNQPVNQSWEDDSCVLERGFFQVSVFYRPGEGQVQASELADALIAFFPKGTVLDNVQVRQRPYQSPAVIDQGDNVFIPVTIPYIGIT